MSEGLLGEPRKHFTSAKLEVGTGAPSYPKKLPRINLEESVMRLLILSSVLLISALIRKASAPTPGWRPFWLKLLMVMTMRQSSCFLKHHTAKILIQGSYLVIQLSWKLC